jgi:(p)ppGpp synthase/HD superfamily hydrolase
MNDLLCWESKYQNCTYSESLINKICIQNKTSNHKVDILQIKKAIYYAKKYHGSQKRLSGEPYYSHPLTVAELVAPYCFKTDILVTSILHDTLEDTELTKDMLEYIFDANIASKVDDLTRVKIDRKISSAEMVQLLYISKKYNLLLIKMFDRVHNMQTIKYKSIEKSKKITDETLKSFLTLAAYFRLNTLKIIDVEEQITQLCYQSISKNLTTNDSNLFLENCFFQLPPLPEFQND